MIMKWRNNYELRINELRIDDSSDPTPNTQHPSTINPQSPLYIPQKRLQISAFFH